MDIKEFKAECQNLIDQLEYYINVLPSQGLKSNDCQRANLTLKLSEFEMAVNGTTSADMVDVNSLFETLENLAKVERESYLDEEERAEYKEIVELLDEHDVDLPNWVKPIDELRGFDDYDHED